jgi:hypothetical protein
LARISFSNACMPVSVSSISCRRRCGVTVCTLAPAGAVGDTALLPPNDLVLLNGTGVPTAEVEG